MAADGEDHRGATLVVGPGMIGIARIRAKAEGVEAPRKAGRRP